jgi:hypothetical protein
MRGGVILKRKLKSCIALLLCMAICCSWVLPAGAL